MAKPWIERIEPLPNSIDGPQTAALVSIAISLKRLADAWGKAADADDVPDWAQSRTPNPQQEGR